MTIVGELDLKLKQKNESSDSMPLLIAYNILQKEIESL
jgi:hypothetical protein